VNNVADMVNDPQVAAREMLVDFDIPGIGKVPLNGVVVKMSETPGSIDMPGPRPGEHNQEVYSAILGFTPEKLAQLKAEGVV
jgi:formyl-CoA transferase